MMEPESSPDWNTMIHNDIVTYMNDGEYETALMLSVSYPPTDINLLTQVIPYVEDINYTKHGHTLYLCIQALLETPDEAIRSHQLNVLRVLLDQGVDPNIPEVGEPVLNYIFRSTYDTTVSGTVDIVRLLLEYGVDPNMRDESGFTPLLILLQIPSNRMSIQTKAVLVDMLLNAGASAKIFTYRVTPLRAIVFSDGDPNNPYYESIIVMLLKAGDDMDHPVVKRVKDQLKIEMDALHSAYNLPSDLADMIMHYR
jgi:hypothetical protein